MGDGDALEPHPRVRLLTIDDLNPAVRRNRAASIAQGENLAFIDDDQEVVYGLLVVWNESAGDTRELIDSPYRPHQDFARSIGFGLIGTLAMWTESSLKVFDAWLGLSFLFSGYVMPLDLYPPAIRATGTGSAVSFGRIGAVISGYVGAWALDVGDCHEQRQLN